MSQEKSRFQIAADKVPGALAAVKNLLTKTKKMHGGSYTDGGSVLNPKKRTWIPSFAWVDMQGLTDAVTLAEAMAAWRWEVTMGKDGGVSGIVFVGQKFGDDEVLMQAIAPFVTPRSYIQLRGGDDHRWIWTFDGKTFREIPVESPLD